MKGLLAKGVVAFALAAAGFAVPQVASADTPVRSFSDCMDIAVGENDADPWIARDACDSDSLTTCYRIFRNEYGRQAWALEACQARDD
ncbi:hypothetical protein ACQPW3_11955 [Actinosynnema sp. CA-248983]